MNIRQIFAVIAMIISTSAFAQVNQYIGRVVESKYLGQTDVMIQCDGQQPMILETWKNGEFITEVLSDCVKTIKTSVYEVRVAYNDQIRSVKVGQRYLSGDFINVAVTIPTGAIRLW